MEYFYCKFEDLLLFLSMDNFHWNTKIYIDSFLENNQDVVKHMDQPKLLKGCFSLNASESLDFKEHIGKKNQGIPKNNSDLTTYNLNWFQGRPR